MLAAPENASRAGGIIVIDGGMTMKSRLDNVTNWDERLASARWQAKALARSCGISEWELRHYVHCKFGCGLHTWIRRKRMQEAIDLLKRKVQIKNIGPELGYMRLSHFSRDFKQFYGASPRAYIKNLDNGDGLDTR